MIIYLLVYAKSHVIYRVNFTQKLTHTAKIRVIFIQKLTLMSNVPFIILLVIVFGGKSTHSFKVIMRSDNYI